MIIAIIRKEDNLIRFNHLHRGGDAEDIALVDSKGRSDTIQLVMRWTCFGLSLISIFCLFVRVHYEQSWIQSVKYQAGHVEELFDAITSKNVKSCWDSVFTFSFMCELLILLVGPIPWYETYI